MEMAPTLVRAVEKPHGHRKEEQGASDVEESALEVEHGVEGLPAGSGEGEAAEDRPPDG